MEVHRQQCQNCGSYDARNILARETGQPQTVYVRCTGCQQLVARYVLRDYYHHGKGIESFLKSHGPSATESGRLALDEFRKTEQDALAGYQQVLEDLKKAGKEV